MLVPNTGRRLVEPRIVNATEHVIISRTGIRVDQSEGVGLRTKPLVLKIGKDIFVQRVRGSDGDTADEFGADPTESSAERDVPPNVKVEASAE